MILISNIVFLNGVIKEAFTFLLIVFFNKLEAV
jgi:hypothetical protein